MFNVIFVRLMQSLPGILKVPAAICPLPVWDQFRPRPFYYIIIKYSRH